MHIFQQGSQEAPSDRLPTARPGDVRGTACARSDGTLGRTDFRIIPTLVFTFVNAENFDSKFTSNVYLSRNHGNLLRVCENVFIPLQNGATPNFSPKQIRNHKQTGKRFPVGRHLSLRACRCPTEPSNCPSDGTNESELSTLRHQDV